MIEKKNMMFSRRALTKLIVPIALQNFLAIAIAMIDSIMIAGKGEDAMKRGVVIAHDCRINARTFAEVSAEVLCANGIKVYLFDALRPTPVLSYAIGALNCIAGIT